MQRDRQNAAGILNLQEICNLPFESHSYFLQKNLQEASIEQTFLTLRHICDMAAWKEASAELSLAAFLRFEELQPLFDYERLSGLYDYAGQQKDPYLQTLLMRGHFARRHKSNLANFVDDEPPRISVQLESFTLGERRAFAKGHQQKKLQMVLYDSDPVVISNLLDNPRIYEKEVLKVASRRPQAAKVLLRIFAHQRWAANYAVRKALVFNPDTPEYLAAGLVNFVQPHDLKLLFEIGELLPASILARAEVLLQIRAALPGVEENKH